MSTSPQIKNQSLKIMVMKELTFVSSVFPSPLAPKSRTLKVVEWPTLKPFGGEGEGEPFFGLGNGGDGGEIYGDGLIL